MKNTRLNGVFNWRLNAGRVFTAALLALAIGSGVQAQTAAQDPASVYIETRQSGQNARIEVLSGVYAASSAVSAQQSRLIFYRTAADGTLPGATSIFVNDAYHTSLVPGAYSDLCLAPASLELGARQMRVGSQPRDQVDSITALSSQSGQTVYVKVHERTGRPVLQLVTAAVAQQELMGLRRQVHTVSRVPQGQACQLTGGTEQAPQQIQLSADALFEFGRSDLAGMTSAGQSALQELALRIHSDYADIERLHIVGHADPLGSPAANEKLAYDRATTVRQFIEKLGLTVRRMTSEGRAAREPVVTQCERTVSRAAIACNQPNRRVVVEVVGRRR